MRVLVPVFIIGIIAVTILIVIKMVNLGAERRRQLDKKTNDLKFAERAINAIETELNLQVAADYSDLRRFAEIIDNYKNREDA